MALKFEDVYESSTSCGDHPVDLKKGEVEGVRTVIALGRCYCSSPGWNLSYETCGSYCDSESFALGKLKSGKWATVFESSDTTGHGCQCSGGTAIFETLEKAMSLGLTDDQRAAAKPFLTKRARPK